MRRYLAARRGLSIAVQLVLTVLFGLFVAGGVGSAYFFFVSARHATAGGSGPLPDIPVLYLPVPGQKPVPVVLRQVTTVTTVNWEKQERVNILLLGVDQRPGEQSTRTDTMILATLDPATHTAGMLSIPRDMYVPIPGYGDTRINEAYVYGEQKKYPGGGPALTKKTVQYNLGVPVNYYVRIDFAGFRRIVDAVGGIDIDVPAPIIDDTYPDDHYEYEPVYIEAGRQHMDGDLALKYARSRHGNSDFDRAQRQQEVLFALRDQALKLNLLPKLPELMVILAGTVQTDLQPTEILNLAQIAWNIDRSRVKTAVLGNDYTVRWVTPTGADVVVPVRDRIRPVVDAMFRSAPQVAAGIPVTRTQTVTETVTTRLVAQPTRLATESARISVLNGTAQADLAARVTTYLEQQGYLVTAPGDSGRTDYLHTVIVDYTGKAYSLAELANLLNVAQAEVRHSPNPLSDVDIRVVLGADFRPPDGS